MIDHIFHYPQTLRAIPPPSLNQKSVLLCPMGLKNRTFLCPLASLGRPWGSLWAPLGAKAEKVRKKEVSRANSYSILGHFLLLFVKKRCFFRRCFPDTFFYRFSSALGPFQTLKIKQNHRRVARNQVFAEIKKNALGETF